MTCSQAPFSFKREEEGSIFTPPSDLQEGTLLPGGILLLYIERQVIHMHFSFSAL